MSDNKTITLTNKELQILTTAINQYRKPVIRYLSSCIDNIEEMIQNGTYKARIIQEAYREKDELDTILYKLR